MTQHNTVLSGNVPNGVNTRRVYSQGVLQKTPASGENFRVAKYAAGTENQEGTTRIFVEGARAFSGFKGTPKRENQEATPAPFGGLLKILSWWFGDLSPWFLWANGKPRFDRQTTNPSYQTEEERILLLLRGGFPSRGLLRGGFGVLGGHLGVSLLLKGSPLVGWFQKKKPSFLEVPQL